MKKSRGGANGKPSIFDEIDTEDIVFAFFPCTRFSCQAQTVISCNQPQMKNTPDRQKLERTIEKHDELSRLFNLISKLAMIAIDRNLKLVIENPATPPHYLSMYWCLKPSIVDKDRTERGDFAKKPTQYWFIGFEPLNNFIFEPLDLVDTVKIKRIKSGEKDRQTLRSEIHPQYANRFIREHILDRELWENDSSYKVV